MNPIIANQIRAADEVMAANGETQPGDGRAETRAQEVSVPKITLLWDDELCARNTPLPPPLIEGYIRRGEVSLLAAGSKAGKSWLLLQAAKCIGGGVPFLGCATERGTSVFLNTEIAEAFWEERSRKQNEALGISSPRIAHASTRGQEITIRNVIPLLKMAIEEKGLAQVDLIAIDPYYTLTAGIGENEAGDVAAAMLGFQKMAEELNAAIWITHHFTKGDAAGKAQLDRASGSGVFARSVDNFFTLTKNAQDKMILELTRRNGDSPPPLEVEFDFPIWKRIGEAEAIAPKKCGRGNGYNAETIVEAFPFADAVLKWGDLRKALDVGDSTLSRYKAQAIREGVIVEVAGGYRLSTQWADWKRGEN